MKPMIIGLAGAKGAGKSTIAHHLVLGVEQALAYKAQRANFAGPLKEACAKLYALDHDQLYGDRKEEVDPRWGLSARQILQRVGSQMRDDHGEDFWVQHMRGLIERETAHDIEGYYRTLGTCIIIDDVRYENEVAMIRELGGSIHGIERPEIKADDDDHESEQLAKNLVDHCHYHWLVEDGRQIETARLILQIEAAKMLEGVDLE